MKSTALFFGVLLHSASLVCMDENTSLIANPSTTSLKITSLRSSYQLPVSTNNSNLKGSLPLREMLAMRHPQFEPLLAQSVREKNVDFLNGMGTLNAQSRVCKAIGAFTGINALKNILALGVWGFGREMTATALIPPNHFMNLTQACVEVCWQLCDEEACHLFCSDTGNCPVLVVKNIAYPVGAAFLANFVVFAGSLIKSSNASTHKKKSQKMLEDFLEKLDQKTIEDAQESNLQTLADESPLSLPNMLDKQIAQAAAQVDEEILEGERQENISLIQSIGDLSMSTKLWTAAALICGVNLINDTIIGSIWGTDTHYPAQASNKSNATCHNVCTLGGCCTVGCPIGTCHCINQTVCTEDKTITPNPIGYSFSSTALCNVGAGIVSALLAYDSIKKQKTHAEKMAKHFKNLDALIEEEAQQDVRLSFDYNNSNNY